MKISDVNLNDLDEFERGTPHHWFELLRREDPVHRHAGPDGEEDYWCVTKHADLVHVCTHPALYSSEEKSALMPDPPPGNLDGLRMIMLNMDPPKHRLYRAIVNRAFTPRMVDNLRPRVEQMVERILDKIVERGACEFVDEVAAPLPMEVICEMVGVPEEDRRGVYEIANRMVAYDDPELAIEEMTSSDDYEVACAEMFGYADRIKERVKRAPGDDLATALLEAEVDGHKLNDLEFNSFFMLLAIAGNDTTRTVTANGMLDLMAHPDQYRALCEDPSLIPSAVEEILRYNPAVHAFRRTAMADTELRGVKIEKGAKMIVWYPSANRDEDVFEDPQTFDIRRSPNDHLSFGVGEHFCLGANLARMELQVIFEALLRRIPDMELAGEPTRLYSNFINGVKTMPVRFTPTKALSATG